MSNHFNVGDVVKAKFTSYGYITKDKCYTVKECIILDSNYDCIRSDEFEYGGDKDLLADCFELVVRSPLQVLKEKQKKLYEAEQELSIYKSNERLLEI